MYSLADTHCARTYRHTSVRIRMFLPGQASIAERETIEVKSAGQNSLDTKREGESRKAGQSILSDPVASSSSSGSR